MARRQDHMLEALKASVDRSGSPAPGVRPVSADPAAPDRSGSPAPAPTGSWVRPASAVEAPVRGAGRGPLKLGTAAFLALQLGLLAASFGVGWLAAGGALPWRPEPVQAAEGPTPLAEATLQLGPVTSTAASGAAPASPAAAGRNGDDAARLTTPRNRAVPPTGTPATAADRALRDPANRFTVVAVQYNSDSAKIRGYADDTYQRLIAAGLPACLPLEVQRGARGTGIVVVVGAAPTTAALAGLTAELKGLPDPRTGRPMFQGPYEVSIDSVLRR